MITNLPTTLEELKEILKTARLCTVCKNIYNRSGMKGNYCKECFNEKEKLAMRKIREAQYKQRAEEARKG